MKFPTPALLSTFLTVLFWIAPFILRADVAQYRAAVQAEPSLLSFYPFDGDTAPTATDRKAPLQNGTLTGATFSSAAGTVGTQSAQGARVALGPVPENEFPDGSGTVEMFLYQNATAGYNPCFFAGRDDSTSPAVRYSMHAGACSAARVRKNYSIWPSAAGTLRTSPNSHAQRCRLNRARSRQRRPAFRNI